MAYTPAFNKAVCHVERKIDVTFNTQIKIITILISCLVVSGFEIPRVVPNKSVTSIKKNIDLTGDNY